MRGDSTFYTERLSDADGESLLRQDNLTGIGPVQAMESDQDGRQDLGGGGGHLLRPGVGHAQQGAQAEHTELAVVQTATAEQPIAPHRPEDSHSTPQQLRRNADGKEREYSEHTEPQADEDGC